MTWEEILGPGADALDVVDEMERIRHREAFSRAIFVLSLPRSGSSCVAGALHRLGVDMGEGHWQPADASNSKGYYEDLRWQYLNKQLAGFQYDAIRVHTLPQRYFEAYRDLFELCSRKPLWGVKAPRMAFVFPLIQPIGVSFCELRVVVVRRNIDDVVASLQRHSEVAYGGRRKMSVPQAKNVIGVWQRALDVAAVGHNGRVFEVSYEALLDETEDALSALAAFCFEGMGQPDTREAVEWIDPSMCHHRQS